MKIYQKLTITLWMIFLIGVSLELTAQEIPNFKDVVENKLRKNYGISFDKICPIETDTIANRVFKEYGAIFVSNNGGKLPARCVFDNESQVSAFQLNANPKTLMVGGTSITLQESAMNALIEAVEEAKRQNLSITPRGGSVAAIRVYKESIIIWNTGFFNGLNYWVEKGKITRQEAENAKSLSIRGQILKVLEWESRGFYFSKDLSKPIFLSVAPPGASQHIFMLAIDVEQFGNKKVREILADYGWFQTVKTDLPHFTYLGVKESELYPLGLKAITFSGHKFWIPNM